MSGKTRLCLHFLTHPDLFEPPPKRIFFHYDQFQDEYLHAKTSLAEKGIELLLYKGCNDISLDNIDKIGEQTILLIDDFSEETSKCKEIARIACNGRHKNISLWLVWHSLFNNHEASRKICQNTGLFFFLPSLRLESQLRSFGTQLGLRDRLIYAYKFCQESENIQERYIVVDSRPQIPDILRVRSHIHLPIQYCYS